MTITPIGQTKNEVLVTMIAHKVEIANGWRLKTCMMALASHHARVENVYFGGPMAACGQPLEADRHESLPEIELHNSTTSRFGKPRCCDRDGSCTDGTVVTIDY